MRPAPKAGLTLLELLMAITLVGSISAFAGTQLASTSELARWQKLEGIASSLHSRAMSYARVHGPVSVEVEDGAVLLRHALTHQALTAVPLPENAELTLPEDGVLVVAPHATRSTQPYTLHLTLKTRSSTMTVHPITGWCTQETPRE